MNNEEMSKRNEANKKRLTDTRKRLDESNYLINNHHTPNMFTRYMLIALFGLVIIELLYAIFKM